MADSYAGFIDIGFLTAEGARALHLPKAQVRPNAAKVVSWLQRLSEPSIGPTGREPLGGRRFLRAYWYDGAFPPAHDQYASQRRFLDAIAYTPGVQLRLGHISERRSRLETPVLNALKSTAAGLGVDSDLMLEEFGKHWTFYPERQQKGVDALLALDLVRLAERGAYETAVLLAGDRDLAEAIRTAQDAGRQVIVATPSRASLASEVAQLADEVIDLNEGTLRELLEQRAPRA